MSESKIRMAPLAEHPSLLEELAALQQAQWQYLNPQYGLEQRIEFLRCSCEQEHLPSTWIALGPDESLLGAAMLVAHDMRDRPDLSPWLASVIVKPEFRRQGIASALIEWVEQAAWSQGVSQLYLYTDQQAGFYARRGWSIVESCDYSGVAVTIMAKPAPVGHTRESAC
nr:GNAT family N-acetyltransferase [Oceanococcus sp. HetDA_MAG_MS8]